MKSIFFKISLLFVVLFLTCSVVFAGGSKEKSAEKTETEASEYVFRKAADRRVHINMGANGGVASGGPMGPTMGVKALIDGGNAIDAAVTAAAMSTVTQYMGSNIGGHGNMILYIAKTGEVKFLDWGGNLPNGFTIDQWGTPPAAPAERSVDNCVLPGTLKGWDVALKEYGTISLAEALAPAIKYAEEGFPVYPALAEHLASIEEELELYPDMKEMLYPEGRPPKEGEIFKLTDYANTLKQIAREGADVFYKGELAKKIVSFLNENGSRFTLEEFANFKPIWRDLLKTTYRDEYEIFVSKNQNFSPVILTMFNIWENFDMHKRNPVAADTLHIIAEASKIGLNDRVYYGDPAQSVIPYDILISKEYAKAIADKIKMNSVLPDKPGGDITGMVNSLLASAFEVEKYMENRSHISTTSIAAVDKEGNVALITQTIGSFDGSMHVVPGTGIILNNEGIYFDLFPENGNNYPAAGRKVENQMGGAIVLKNGKFYSGAATPGGWQIPMQIAQVLLRTIDNNLYMQEALEVPKVAYTGKGKLRIETDFAGEIQKDLEKRGHTVELRSSPASRVVGVKIVNGAKEVGGDPGFYPNHAVSY